MIRKESQSDQQQPASSPKPKRHPRVFAEHGDHLQPLASKQHYDHLQDSPYFPKRHSGTQGKLALEGCKGDDENCEEEQNGCLEVGHLPRPEKMVGLLVAPLGTGPPEWQSCRLPFQLKQGALLSDTHTHNLTHTNK